MLCYHYFVFAFVKATLADTPCPHKFSGHGVSAGDSFGICEFCAVCSKSAPMQSFVIQSNTALWDCCRIAFLSLFVQNNPYFCVAKTTILPFGNSPFMHRAMFVFSSGAVIIYLYLLQTVKHDETQRFELPVTFRRNRFFGRCCGRCFF